MSSMFVGQECPSKSRPAQLVFSGPEENKNSGATWTRLPLHLLKNMFLFSPVEFNHCWKYVVGFFLVFFFFSWGLNQMEAINEQEPD